MNEILKRLELIKTGIELNDTDIIELQINKLKSFSTDNEVHEILHKLEINDYSSVVTKIRDYIAQFNGVTVYEDNEVQGLKLELKVIEKKLKEIIIVKNDYLHEIEEFNTAYRLKLGQLISMILKKEKEILRKQLTQKVKYFEEKRKRFEQIKDEYKDLKAKQAAQEKELDEINEFDDAYDEVYEELQKIKEKLIQKEKKLNNKRKEAKKAKEDLEGDPDRERYSEAKKDYDEFSNDYQEVLEKKSYELSDDEILELKQLFRKAVKLCHPDIVADELKMQAKAIIQQLNAAYNQRDLLKVKEIVSSLKSGYGFKTDSEAINDKDVLKEKILVTRDKISEIEQEIALIKEDDSFQTIQEIDDWDVYFKETEEALQKQYENLLQKVSDDEQPELQTTETGSNDEDNNDDYWNSEF